MVSFWIVYNARASEEYLFQSFQVKKLLNPQLHPLKLKLREQNICGISSTAQTRF